jgi:hypothetical protein
MRAGLVVLAILLFPPAQASAEWQLKPFLGVTFGGGTTLVDLEHAAGKPNVAIGVSGALLGETIGVEADLEYAPGFFQSGSQHLVLQSSVITLTGNLVVALPRHLAEYTLRPYVVGGVGLIRARSEDALGVLSVASVLPALDVGGGVTGPLTDRIGIGWDLRYFRSLGGKADVRGLSFGAERLSFWRANMALSIRY